MKSLLPFTRVILDSEDFGEFESRDGCVVVHFERGGRWEERRADSKSRSFLDLSSFLTTSKKAKAKVLRCKSVEGQKDDPHNFENNIYLGKTEANACFDELAFAPSTITTTLLPLLRSVRPPSPLSSRDTYG